MKIAKRRCEFCHEWFTPDPRTVRTQRSCAKPACRKQRSRAAVRNWRQQNQDCNKGRGPKIREWAKAYPDYWRQYRRYHPEYAAKDNQRRRTARQRAKNAAKRNEIHRRVEGILDYLLWKELSAKQNEMASVPAGERQYEYASGNLGGDKAVESG